MIYVFDMFSLDSDRRELRCGAKVIATQPQVFDLLLLLVRERARVVSKDELIAKVWNGRVVSESTVTSRITAVRHAVGDSAEEQRLIRTAARKGHRFVGEVREHEQLPSGKPAKPAPSNTSSGDTGKLQGALVLPDRPSIAVLPFANLSSDPEQEYFSDGVADDIITELSRDRALFVIARNSSFTYKAHAVDVKQIGRELGVRYVVEGSVRREAGRVRISAQLIDATIGAHVWAERYDRALDHVFAVQDEIAGAVARAIRPALGDAERLRVLRKPIDSLSAWETYQRGLWHLSRGTRTENEQARLLFRQAAEIDKGFAAAHVGLVRTYRNDAIPYRIPSFAEAAKLIEVEAREAVTIDPNDSEAQNALALAFFVAGNFDAALDCSEKALALNRNSAAAHGQKGAILTFSGRCPEGRDELYTSLRLNPRDPSSHIVAGGITRSFYFERDYAASVAAAQNCLARYPGYPAPRRWLVAALGQLGRRDEAETALHDWRAIVPDGVDTVIRHRFPYMRSEDHEHMLDGVRKAGWPG
jgi:TolB-like protein